MTHPAREALAIWEEFGTPEVWVYRPRVRFLIVMVLGIEGRFAESTSSLAFPFLEPGEVVDWLDQVGSEPINRWMRRLRTWVRDVLVPRVKGNTA